MIQIPGSMSVSSTFKYSSNQETLHLKRQATPDDKSVGTDVKIDTKQFSYQARIKAEFDLKNQAGVYTASDDKSEFQDTDQETEQGIIPDEASLISIPISELTPGQAAELIGEDGYYGIKQTSQRILEFVLAGAGEDLARLRAGREGVLRGYQEAQELWGGSLPDLSRDTIDRTLEGIDEKIDELGGSVLDITT